jgi:hypothetical protein
VKLLVVGGRQKRNAGNLPEWHRYEAGLVAEVDCERDKVRIVYEYYGSPDALPPDGGSVIFKAATLEGKRLYLCTQTEILVCRILDFSLESHISLPQFNDLHHVRPRIDGSLLAASTGIDSILHLSSDGRLLFTWPVLEPGTAKVFPEMVDFRRIPTTKPHASHPNFVFELDGQVWATRFEQRDAVCVEDLSRRIAIDVERPHDGILHHGELYFTTIDGRVAIANAESRSVTRIYDLSGALPSRLPLGWCRGISVISRNSILVGFSRIRSTRFKENLRWISDRTRGKETSAMPTRVVHVNLAAPQSVREWNLEDAGMNAIFSIHILA